MPAFRHTLPHPRQRMTALRKLAILEALRDRQVTRAFVLGSYSLTEEELRAWEKGYADRGLDGLAVHKLQEACRG